MDNQQGGKRLSNLPRTEQETTSSNLSLSALPCILERNNVHWPGGGNWGIANAGASKNRFSRRDSKSNIQKVASVMLALKMLHSDIWDFYTINVIP